VIVLSMSQERWDTLSAEQQGWVREAAEMAVQASIDATYDENTPAQELCEMGARFYEASPEQIAALNETLAPMLDGLAADSLFGQVQAISSQHPVVESPEVSEDCREAAVGADPTALDAIPDEVATIPEGVYRVDITEADVEAAGVPVGPGFPGTWTVTIADGTYALSCRPIDDPERDCGGGYGDDGVLDPIFEAGVIYGTGNTVFFVYDSEVHSELTGCDLPCQPVPTIQVNWELEGDVMTFSDEKGEYGAYHLLVNPWTKIG